MKYEFLNLEIRFQKSRVSFKVVKTVMCKRRIKKCKTLLYATELRLKTSKPEKRIATK